MKGLLEPVRLPGCNRSSFDLVPFWYSLQEAFELQFCWSSSSKSFSHWLNLAFLLQNRTICLHLCIQTFEPPSPGFEYQLCSPLRVFWSSYSWEVARSFLQGLGLTGESMLPSAGIMLRICSPSDKKAFSNPSSYLKCTSLPIACCFCSHVKGFLLPHCNFLLLLARLTSAESVLLNLGCYILLSTGAQPAEPCRFMPINLNFLARISKLVATRQLGSLFTWPL